MLMPQDLFDLKNCNHQAIFSNDEAVWTVLDRLKDYLNTFFQESWPLRNITPGQIEKPLVIHNGKVCSDAEVKTTCAHRQLQIFMKGELLEDAALVLPGAYLFDNQIVIGPGTIIEPGVLIKGPVVIGSYAEIRQGAYMRGDCLVGDRCVVGHTTEMKNSVMLDGARAAHFAYIGDSILGNDVNLGAGTKLANLKIIRGTINIVIDRKCYETGRRKLGAILGDRTETGCNSVISPGTLLGPDTLVYPSIAVPGGYYPAKTIIMPSRDSLRILSRN